MDVIAMLPEIVLVAKPMLPIACLPDSASFLASMVRRYREFCSARLEVCVREATLDQPPPSREIIVSCWQLPDAVQMIGQENERRHLERSLLARAFDRIPKVIPRRRCGQDRLPSCRDNGKEMCRAIFTPTNVCRHDQQGRAGRGRL